MLFNRIIYLLFSIVSYLEILSEYLGLHEYVYILKPLLMPILICYVFYNIDIINKKPKVYLLLALFFAMLGDVFLMFSDFNEIFFLIGLSMFLITHGFYIVLFLTTKRAELNLGKLLVSILIIISYYFSLMFVIADKLYSYAIPVYVYGIVLSFMLFVAFISGYQKQKKNVVIGAILFVLSDSLIAITKFYMTESNEFIGSVIMLTYVLGQFFIVYGVTKYLSSSRI